MMKLSKIKIFFVGLIFIFSCNSNKQETETVQKEPNLKQKADSLAHRFIITDGHVDLPYALQAKGFDHSNQHLKNMVVNTEEGNFDYTLAKRGGLDAPFMSVYVAAEFQETGGAKEEADSLIAFVQTIINNLPEKFAAGRSPDEVQANFEKGLISLPMGMENGAPIGDDLNNVQYFFDRGIRYITLTHSKDNQICDSSYDTTRTWNGLSPFGKEVVKEMNRVGIMIDVSHISDSTFYQVIELSEVPVIATHSSCRHFTPGWERNMSDDMIKTLGENGGVISINFGTSFLNGEKADMNKQSAEQLTEILTEKGVDAESEDGKALTEEFRKKNPFQYATLSRVVDHIDHVVEIAGIDHVAFGSDFDGVGDSLPEGLKDVSTYPNLIEELLKRGYSDEDIEKICYKNTWRVWNTALNVVANR